MASSMGFAPKGTLTLCHENGSTEEYQLSINSIDINTHTDDVEMHSIIGGTWHVAGQQTINLNLSALVTNAAEIFGPEEKTKKKENRKEISLAEAAEHLQSYRIMDI